jgi:eukaryotic-like serine/threonine-protein kinase
MKAIPTIPGYELLTRLGGGLLTSVFAARDLANDSGCAIKVLREDWEDQPTAVKLLQREARACMAAQHRHLVRLLGANVTRPPYYLVMELLPGESLRRCLRRDYRLTVPTAVWVARQTAEALAALHRAGFVHGDVKPDNIRLLGDGNAVLLDLGFAHRPGENNSILRQGYVLGTVDYLAPELCAEHPGGDQASDLFSLGVTLFETLTGQFPYPAGTVEETMRRHEADPPADVRELLPDLHPALARLVTRLLARRPRDRPKAHAVVPQLVALEIAALHRRRTA